MVHVMVSLPFECVGCNAIECMCICVKDIMYVVQTASSAMCLIHEIFLYIHSSKLHHNLLQ